MSLSKPSLSYVSSPQRNGFTYQTVPERFQHIAELHPNKLAFLDIDENGEVLSKITYGELLETSVRFAKGLIEQGVKKGEIVGISLPNKPEWIYCFIGILLAGGIPMCLEFFSKDGKDVLCVLEKSENCTLVIIDAQCDENFKVCENIFEKISDNGDVNCKRLPKMRKVIFTNPPPLLSETVVVQDVILTGESLDDKNFPNISPEDYAILLLTSGTTGTQKIVPKTHMEFLHIGHQMSCFLDLNGNSIYFNPQPMSWIASAPVSIVWNGLTRVSCSLRVFQSDDVTTTLLKILEKQRCTSAFLYPSVCMNLARRDRNLTNGWRLHSVITGGIPLPASCAGITPKYVDVLVTAYGSTELDFVSMARVTEQVTFSEFDAGCPVGGIELKIVNEEGNVVQRNIQGEIYVRKTIRFTGYHNEPILNRKILTSNSWFKTDDIGILTEAGRVIIYGRKSDMIKVSNDVQDELVSPVHIEQQIKEMAGISAVCVLPFTNDRKLTEICACVEMEKGKEICESEIAEFLKSKVITSLTDIPDLTFPTKYIFFEKLPRTSVGKINRRKTTEEAYAKLLNK